MCALPLQALRMDPDCSSSRRGIKRLRSMNSAKEQGNQAFKLQRWGEAHQHYSQAIEMDPQLQSSFMVQCLCNRCSAFLLGTLHCHTCRC